VVQRGLSRWKEDALDVHDIAGTMPCIHPMPFPLTTARVETPQGANWSASEILRGLTSEPDSTSVR
jgi:hypothetical protein